jgi:hypothetical protein
MDESVETVPPNSQSISSIYSHINISQYPWGGYLFLNQTDTEQTPGVGVDLSGATALVFQARSAGAPCKIEFFMGGFNNEWRSQAPGDLRDSADRCSTGDIELNSEWREVRIDLRGVNLTRIMCGFAWVAHNRENPNIERIEFFIDNIHYEYPAPLDMPVFIESYAPLPPSTRGFELNSAAYTYDNAVACISLIAANQLFHAQLIADALWFAISNDFVYTDGRLRNAYAAGNPQSSPGWVNASGEPYARLAGHWNTSRDIYVEDAYMSSSATGTLAWAIIAFCQAHANCPRENHYLEAAERLASMVFAFTDSSDAAGYFAGLEGGPETQEPAYYKATEHNITLIAAFKLLAALVEKISPEKYETYLAASQHAKKFVLTMYDAQTHHFLLGVNDDGTANNAIIPLDTQTWGLLVLGNDVPDRAGVLNFLDSYLAVGEGFDFSYVPAETKQRGVWMEGTAQALLCYQAIEDTERVARLSAVLTSFSNPDGSINATDGIELFTGLYLAGSGAAWVYPPRQHLGATAWKALAEMKINPFELIGK